MAHIEKYTRNDILTYTNKRFDPWQIVPEDVDVRDIAHALSLMTRANGHLAHFYSVAQHSVNCALEAKARGHSPRVQLGCLTHDAAESYISDITRPVKHRLEGYKEVEERILSVVWQSFGLGDITGEEKRKVFEIDDAVLYHEFFALKNACLRPEMPDMAMEHDFSQRDMCEVEAQYLTMFKALALEV